MIVVGFIEENKDFFIICQAFIGISVYLFFENHWQRKDTIFIYIKNPKLLEQYDKKILDHFKYFYAVVPLTSFFLFYRQNNQNFSTIAFLNDYARKKQF